MNTRILVAALTLLALPPEDLAFDAQPGDALRREFRETTRWKLVEMVESVGGRGGGDELPEIEGELTRVFSVRDELRGVGDGRPTTVARTIREAAADALLRFAIDGVEEEYEVEMTSPLVDAELLVEWNDEDEDYTAKLVSGGDVEGFAGLVHDLDLLVLLPAGEVAEGDAWDVEDDALLALLAPGGALALELVEFPAGGAMGMEPLEILCAALCSAAECAGEVDGGLRITWTETVEEDGENCALLELELEAEFSRKLEERVAQLLESGGTPLPDDFRLLTEWSVDGKGVCLWSLDAGTARSLHLELDTTIVATIGLSAYGTEVESEYGLAGTTELDFAFEAD